MAQREGSRAPSRYRSRRTSAARSTRCPVPTPAKKGEERDRANGEGTRRDRRASVHRIVTSRRAMRVDHLDVTEPVAASEPGTTVAQPSPVAADGGEPATTATRPIPAIADVCSQCAAPLASDQRYCLHCGTPRAHVSGPISGGRPGGPPPRVAASPDGPRTAPPGASDGHPGTPPGF